MTEYTAKKVYIKDADGSYAVPYVNPADANNLGAVKPDGVTITTAADGTISTINTGLSAITAYANNGELLQDADGLAFVEKYAHSTFDRSKFTVVGSPNVTDDGIASGFSDSNYLYTPEISFGTSSFDIIACFNSAQTQSSYNRIYQGANIGTSNNVGAVLLLRSDGYLEWEFRSVNTSITSSRVISSYTIQNNIDYWVKISYRNGVFTVNISTDGEHYTQIDTVNANVTENVVCNLSIGKSMLTYNRYFNGSIDLKQFLITVDGAPVFSGNKTGIDTIKPDDYTVVGTPTISADGVASNFSSGNYIYKDNLSSLSNGSFELISPKIIYNTAVASGVTEMIYAINSTTGVSDNSHLSTRVYGNYLGFLILASGTQLYRKFDAVPITVGNVYQTKISYNAATQQVSIYYKENEGNWTLVNTPSVTGTFNFTNSHKMYIGSEGGVSSFITNVPVGLNGMYIYSNGDLVYQPCLKIPYTESKTGSKIVDSVYRDRVNDMAEQFGYANYYTLDEDNGNFTLPQVELYGLIEKLSNIPDYGSVITVSDINGSSKAYTIGSKCLAIIKPSTPATTYTISVQPAYGSAYKSISGYGFMTLEFDTGDKVYASVASSMDVYLIR